MEYSSIIVVALLASTLGIEILEFSCEFKDTLCEWGIANKPASLVQWKLSADLSSEDEAMINPDLPNDVKNDNCLLAYSQTKGEGILTSTANITSTISPKFIQFELFLNAGAELVIHLKAKRNHLIFHSAKDSEMVYGQWKTLRVNIESTLNISLAFQGQYIMSIEADISNTWFALRYFKTLTTDDSYSAEATTAETTNYSEEYGVITSAITSRSEREETGSQDDTNTVETTTEYFNNQSDELKGFEKLLSDLKWKNVLAILICVFFGTVIIASIVRVSIARSKIVLNDEEEILFDGLETASSLHKYYYKNY